MSGGPIKDTRITSHNPRLDRTPTPRGMNNSGLEYEKKGSSDTTVKIVDAGRIPADERSVSYAQFSINGEPTTLPTRLVVPLGRLDGNDIEVQKQIEEAFEKLRIASDIPLFQEAPTTTFPLDPIEINNKVEPGFEAMASDEMAVFELEQAGAGSTNLSEVVKARDLFSPSNLESILKPPSDPFTIFPKEDIPLVDKDKIPYSKLKRGEAPNKLAKLYPENNRAWGLGKRIIMALPKGVEFNNMGDVLRFFDVPEDSDIKSYGSELSRLLKEEGARVTDWNKLAMSRALSKYQGLIPGNDGVRTVNNTDNIPLVDSESARRPGFSAAKLTDETLVDVSKTNWQAIAALKAKDPANKNLEMFFGVNDDALSAEIREEVEGLVYNDFNPLSQRVNFIKAVNAASPLAFDIGLNRVLTSIEFKDLLGEAKNIRDSGIQNPKENLLAINNPSLVKRFNVKGTLYSVKGSAGIYIEVKPGGDLSHGRIFIGGVFVENGDLDGVDLSHMDFRSCYFRGRPQYNENGDQVFGGALKMREASMIQSRFENCIFRNIDMSSKSGDARLPVQIARAHFEGCEFDYVDMHGIDSIIGPVVDLADDSSYDYRPEPMKQSNAVFLGFNTIRNSNLDNSKLPLTVAPGLVIELSDCNGMNFADSTGPIIMDGCDAMGANFRDYKHQELIVGEGKNQEEVFTKLTANITEVKSAKGKKEKIAIGGDFSGSDWTGAMLPSAAFNYLNFHGASLDGAQMPDADIESCLFNGDRDSKIAKYRKPASLKNINLSAARIKRTVMNKADLTSADFSSPDKEHRTTLFAVSFAGAKMNRAKLSGANLVFVDFDQVAKKDQSIILGNKNELDNPTTLIFVVFDRSKANLNSIKTRIMQKAIVDEHDEVIEHYNPDIVDDQKLDDLSESSNAMYVLDFWSPDSSYPDIREIPVEQENVKMFAGLVNRASRRIDSAAGTRKID